jgi:hypothetical protein
MHCTMCWRLLNPDCDLHLVLLNRHRNPTAGFGCALDDQICQRLPNLLQHQSITGRRLLTK